MEDIRPSRIEDDETRRLEEEAAEYLTAAQDDEVPFHIPRTDFIQRSSRESAPLIRPSGTFSPLRRGEG